MRAAGGFVVAGRLVVRQDDLDRWEREQAEIARRAQQPVQATRAQKVRRQARRQSEPLERDWWRRPAETAES